jgi:hypothetical protein
LGSIPIPAPVILLSHNNLAIGRGGKRGIKEQIGGLKELLWNLDGLGHGTLLDMGPASQTTLSFFIERVNRFMKIVWMLPKVMVACGLPTVVLHQKESSTKANAARPCFRQSGDSERT